MGSAPDLVESRIQQHLAAVLESAGVNPAFVVKAVERIDAALDARRVQRIHVGEGDIREFQDIDHSTRLSAVDRALDLASRAGLIPAPADARRGSGSGPAISVSIVILGSEGEKRLVKIQPELSE